MAKNQRTLIQRVLPTAHKKLLNRLVEPRLREISGDVLVIGAGKVPYRAMMPSASSLCCTDIDDDVGIDLVVDAHALPFDAGSFDAVIAIEVFEHLRDPRLASAEIRRVLRDGGIAFVTVPFLFRVHGDPFDFHRFTKWGLEEVFKDFSKVDVYPFGNRLHVISDILTTASRPAVAFSPHSPSKSVISLS